jgi:AcrR family transcriptional regulator
MKQYRQLANNKRRNPQQARARGTIEAIVEAAAQILERDGPDALTTNRIAERAGVSIGSLYQYFADKDAIVLAVARRELGKGQAAALAALAQAPSDPEQRARLVIRTLGAAFGMRRKLRRHLLEALYAQGRHDELNRPVAAIAQAMALRAERLAPNADTGAGPVRIFVLTRAVAGVIRAAALEDAPFLGSALLEDELVALITRYTAPMFEATS